MNDNNDEDDDDDDKDDYDNNDDDFETVYSLGCIPKWCNYQEKSCTLIITPQTVGEKIHKSLL